MTPSPTEEGAEEVLGQVRNLPHECRKSLTEGVGYASGLPPTSPTKTSSAPSEACATVAQNPSSSHAGQTHSSAKEGEAQEFCDGLPAAEAALAAECPACGSAEFQSLFRATDRLYKTTEKEFRIVECGRCRLMRLDPRPEPAELRQYYPHTYWYARGAALADRLEESYRRVVLKDHVRFVRRALEAAGEPGRLLDVGCGGGLFLRMMAERGAAVLGLDFSLDAAIVAGRENGVAVACGTLSHAPFPPGSCAAVTMFHVLEHLYDPLSYLEAAHALLKPDGRLIVQVPNAACWQFLLLGENWSGLDVPRHLYDFRPRDLEILLDQAGFEILRTKHFSPRDNPAGMATSLAPWLDPMARRVRGAPETPARKLCKDLAYFCLVAACLPFTVLEAACRAGSTIMMEARKK